MPKAKVKRRGSARGVGDFDKTIGNRIRGFRINRDMSQEDLAQRLGVSFQQIQKYEKGVNRLSAGRLVEMAKLLHTTPHELLAWDGIGIKMDAPLNVENFKLAQAFNELREDLKPAFRALINTITRAEK